MDFISLEIDHDLEPGKPTKMTSKFLSHADTHFQKMQLKVYLAGVKVFGVEDSKPAELHKDKEFTYDFSITLPSIVPHVQVTMKMYMLGGANNKEELNCVAYDVHM